MAGHDFAYLDGEPTKFLETTRERRRQISDQDTYRGPGLALSRAIGELMWSVDRVRRAVEARIDDVRNEEPELRRLDGVLIWFVSSVLTAISLLGGLYLLG
jgi:hypothetical protein